MYSFFIARVSWSLRFTVFQQFLFHGWRAWPRPFRSAINHTAHDLFFMAQPPLVGQGLLIIEASRLHSYTPHSIGILWTSYQPDAETSTWQHTTLTLDRHPCTRRDSNLRFQQASGCRPSLRPRGHWARPFYDYPDENINIWLGCSGNTD
jgi:hypothetical protein